MAPSAASSRPSSDMLTSSSSPSSKGRGDVICSISDALSCLDAFLPASRSTAICGAGGLLLLYWLRRLSKQPWAPLKAELEMARTLLYDGVARIFYPKAHDGTIEMTLKERVARVQDLRQLLVLERNHQIDAARRARTGEDGWGKTSGLNHMQHLPGLVFRGEDQAICRAALDRSARLFASPPQALALQKQWEETPILKDLVFVGGGHTHAGILRMLGMEPLPGVRVTLITRDVETPYSGMLPGHVAGDYTRRECHLDLNVLARFARVRMVHATAVNLDLKNKRVILDSDRPPIGYDVLSINIGSAPKVQGGDETSQVTPVKPIAGFGAKWDAILEGVQKWCGIRRVYVVGGGAGGFELAMTMEARLQKELQKCGNTSVQLEVKLVCRSELLPQHNPGVRALAKKCLEERGVEVLTGYEVTHATEKLLHCKGGKTLPFDDCIWCTQVMPQAWVRDCGLRTDKDGFLLVNQHMQCSLAPGIDVGPDNGGPIFAAGDIASIEEHERPKAGVFAVMAGMALWINLRATLLGEKKVTYWPQSNFLGLFNLGDGTCIASRGLLALEGRWLWALKDWIDRRWMWNYTLHGGLPEMAESLDAGVAEGMAKAAGSLELLKHATMRCGGCGAKVGATTLSAAMARVTLPQQPGALAQAKVAVGVGDDAAVVELLADNSQASVASVQTIDFFRSFVADPFRFGRVAAVHALSDCEAMGAVAQTALALVQIPFSAEEKQEEDIVQLMAGAATALTEAGCALVGGHTCEARELGLGFAVNGRLPGGVSEALKKASLQVGHALILTKPIGTGTLFAADMRAKARGPWIAEALDSMSMLNGRSADILRQHGCSACTDVTGFGLVGHLLEMCRQGGGASSSKKMVAEVELEKLPLYEGALECLAQGISSSLQPANTRLRRSVANHEEARKNPKYPLIFDPQTAGGLLAAVPPELAERCVEALRSSGAAPRACVVGSVLREAPPGEMVELLHVKA